MAFALVPDELWNEVHPLLPREQPKPKGGRPRVPDRNCLMGIVFVLSTGAPWRLVPEELGCGSGVTCWRRLKEWTERGIWPQVHLRLLKALGESARINWTRAVIDSASVRAVFWGCIPDLTQPTEEKAAASGM
jgi:transposase